jgi:hypothetical protein
MDSRAVKTARNHPDEQTERKVGRQLYMALLGRDGALLQSGEGAENGKEGNGQKIDRKERKGRKGRKYTGKEGNGPERKEMGRKGRK